jgi:hypothetical protein
MMQRKVWLGCLACAALSVASLLGLYTQVAQPIRPDMRGAASFLAGQMQSTDRFMFQIPYTRYAFEYYLPRVAPQLPLESELNPSDGLRTLDGLRPRLYDGPYTNAGASEQDVQQAMFSLLVTEQRVWFIEAESGMWDVRGLAHTWLDEHLQLVQRYPFRGVTLYLYEIPQNKYFFKHVFLPVCLASPYSP